MRIASYHNLPSGGAKRSLFEETKGLAERHTVDVFTLSTANLDFADLRPLVANHRVYEFSPAGLFKSPFGRLNQAVRMVNLRRVRALARRIAADIEAGGYDLLYINPCQFENCPSVIRYMDRTPTVYFCHEPLRILYETMPPRPYDRPEAAHRQLLNRIDPLPGLYREDLKANDQQNMRAADLVLANSKFIKQSVREIYTVEAKVNYKGVDTELFRPIDVEREPLILAVGSVTPLKAFDFVVESLSRVPQEYRYRLVIASNFQNPPERDYILSLADQLDVELEMLSDISDELLVELYNRAYLAVYSPIREPLGLVPLEAMACGTPVVAVSEGGIKETVLNGETGFLTPRDADQFARAIQKLVTNPDLAASFGEQGRKHVLANWTWERAVIGLEQHFTALQ